MPVKNKQFAVLQKISRNGKVVYSNLKYMRDLENAKKAALFDFLSATTLIDDDAGGDNDAGGNPQVEVYVGDIRFPVTDVQKLIFDEYGEARWVLSAPPPF
ncbi:MAG: hypothetical protein FWC23_10310 [Chitinispirillia bacterium]|nr:hypothetical protein [Chitinispirillia bacterium]MCL2269560.1 hypothetical protein [Chitinispirillia bacterium]